MVQNTSAYPSIAVRFVTVSGRRNRRQRREMFAGEMFGGAVSFDGDRRTNGDASCRGGRRRGCETGERRKSRRFMRALSQPLHATKV
jgi:hypothetical protein